MVDLERPCRLGQGALYPDVAIEVASVAATAVGITVDPEGQSRAGREAEYPGAIETRVKEFTEGGWLQSPITPGQQN